MSTPTPPDQGWSRNAFLVERYIPPTEVDALAASVARVARLCADLSRDGNGVEYLHSVYLPTEDTCFCLFLAPSPDLVRVVNDEANFALDRLTDAVLLFAGQPTVHLRGAHPSNLSCPPGAADTSRSHPLPPAVGMPSPFPPTRYPETS
jgi:Protein of unknown function (DUF4242)